jgi:biotin carboxyl carrier protein
MRYYVTLDPGPESPTWAVDLEDLPSGALVVHVQDRLVDVDVIPVGDQLSVLVDGMVVDLTTDGVLPDLGATASGRRLVGRVESNRQRTGGKTRKEIPASSEQVTVSPMPGRVVKVLVGKGDSVVAGQPLVVMEAMKMENEIRSKAPGKVAEVHVVAGSAVEAHVKLVTLV